MNSKASALSLNTWSPKFITSSRCTGYFFLRRLHKLASLKGYYNILYIVEIDLPIKIRSLSNLRTDLLKSVTLRVFQIHPK
jgi:hypothetical protein